MKITVIGTIGRTAAQLAGQFPDIDFNFIEIDNFRRLNITTKDPVVLLTKFANHKVYNALRQRDVKIHYCNGGNARLRQVIEQIIQQQGGGAYGS